MVTLWYCLVYECWSYERILELNTTQPVIALGSFGFTENATFSIGIRSRRASRFNMFLADIDRAQLNYRKLRKTCRANNSDLYLVSGLNYSNSKLSQTVSWNGTIETKNIYFPIIVNCGRNESVYSLRMQFRNEDGFIDYRERWCSMLYLVSGSTHALLGVAWIVNSLHFQRFAIPLHYMFGSLPIIKALLNVMKAQEWEERRRVDVISHKRMLSIRIPQFVYSGALLSLISLALSGYCVFRTRYPIQEMLDVVVSSVLLSYGIVLTESSSSANMTVMSMCMITAGFTWYIRTVGGYFWMMINVLESPCSPLVEKKARLLRNFAIATIICAGLVVLVQACALSMNVYMIIETLIYEMGLLLEELVQFFFFALRKEYEGEPMDSDEDVEGIHLVEMNDPENRVFVVIQTKL